jgi:hypothetical protein
VVLGGPAVAEVGDGTDELDGKGVEVDKDEELEEEGLGFCPGQSSRTTHPLSLRVPAGFEPSLSSTSKGNPDTVERRRHKDMR